MQKTIIVILTISMIFLYCTGTSIDDNNDNINDKTGDDKPDLNVPFNTINDWNSLDIQAISTGLAVADINEDGLPDVIVSNGNDIERQYVAVYYNQGDGYISKRPDWTSEDIDYHGHLAVGDINMDGFNDVAVSVFLGDKGFGSPGKTKVYFNRGGQLERTPSWESEESHYSFSLDLGDIDNDGDLDIAVATGESYTHKKEPNRIYINDEGTLNPIAHWEASINDYSIDVSFGDTDNDGDLDIVFAGSKTVSTIYTNENGIISAKPTWTNEESSNSNSVTIGDINQNGYRDIAFTDNYQQGGAGRTKVYYNNDGLINDKPDWESTDRGYGSGIFLQDINQDGFHELITGTWGEFRRIGNGRIRIFKNISGVFDENSTWMSETKSVVEAITFYDLDMSDELIERMEITLDRGISVFYLNHQPIQNIKQIKINGNEIDYSDYCYNRELSWVSINKALLNKDENIIQVEYLYTPYPDMLVSNWDSNKGNYIFFNQKIETTK
jgi:hypothetical protein